MTELQEVDYQAALSYMYLEHQKSDREIAEFLGFGKDKVRRDRRKFGIETNLSTGEIGEKLVIEQLVKLFGAENVQDMNEVDPTSIYDILLFGKIRIEVKSSRLYKTEKSFSFAFSNKEECGIIPNSYTRVTRTGRTIKDVSKTSDIVILVIIENTPKFLTIESNHWLISGKQTVKIIKNTDRYRMAKPSIDYDFSDWL